jgi:hypothetical protein
MMYALALFLHLGIAAATGVVIAGALYALLRAKAGAYRMLALLLGSIAALEVISGTVLAVASPELLAAALSLHIVEYLGVCAAVEALLFIRMKNVSLTFPLVASTSPVFASCAIFFAALAYGF